MSDEVFTEEIKDPAAARAVGEDYVEALQKIIRSHLVNELVGAETVDEPAIALADNPEDKWLACRIAMEEYGHHVHFKRLARDLGFEVAEVPRERAYTLFALGLKDWVHFLAVKALADLTEVLQAEELEQCTYLPLCALAVQTMPEERFHVGFGWNRLERWCADGRADEARAALQTIFDGCLPLFGRSASKNNDAFRRWGIKRRTNGVMRGDYIARVEASVAKLGLPPLDVPEQYAADRAAFEATR